MITDPFLYLFVLAILVAFLYIFEQKTKLKFFSYIPLVVLLYGSAMLLSFLGVFERGEAITKIYLTTKANLLPAMLFLMLLGVDFRLVARLGKSLLIAYFLALFSLAFAFIAAAFVFHFDASSAAGFGALCASWMGGSANMIAVGSALGVSEEMFASMLIVDSVNYTLWLTSLLFLVPFTGAFNSFTGAFHTEQHFAGIGCACQMGAPRYWTLLLLALFVSWLSQFLAEQITLLDKTSQSVLFATLFGVAASFTRLRDLVGADKLATTMLYLLIVLIGSSAELESFDGVAWYLLIGFFILAFHALVMVVGAKLLHLDLFSIGVASLANIGGAASAPLLAATYSKDLVGVGVVMAIMGYLIGTLGGLLVGNILVGMAG